MAGKDIKRGDSVVITAEHLKGIPAVVVFSEGDQFVCRITGSQHPSGHSQEGTLVMFPADQLQLQEQAKVNEISL
jgi:hypothetical protein